MNRMQFALVKLAEECTELAKEALKAAQYGPNQFSNKYQATVSSRMNDEYNDVLGCVEFLDSVGIQLRRDPVAVVKRVKKIQKNIEVSKELGLTSE